MTNKKWIASIAGDPNGELIRIGIKGNQREGYEIICDNDEDPCLPIAKTYEEAVKNIIASWGKGDIWNFEWIG
jgi:hypothetical protein